MPASVHLGMEGVDDFPFDLVAAVGVDGMGDIRVQLDARKAVALLRAEMAVFIEPAAAVVAVAGAEVVFVAATAAVV